LLLFKVEDENYWLKVKPEFLALFGFLLMIKDLLSDFLKSSSLVFEQLLEIIDGLVKLLGELDLCAREDFGGGLFIVLWGTNDRYLSRV